MVPLVEAIRARGGEPEHAAELAALLHQLVGVVERHAGADHASQGLQLARDAVAASELVTARWSKTQTPLSVGAGVASGVGQGDRRRLPQQLGLGRSRGGPKRGQEPQG